AARFYTKERPARTTSTMLGGGPMGRAQPEILPSFRPSERRPSSLPLSFCRLVDASQVHPGTYRSSALGPQWLPLAPRPLSILSPLDGGNNISRAAYCCADEREQPSAGNLHGRGIATQVAFGHHDPDYQPQQAETKCCQAGPRHDGA